MRFVSCDRIKEGMVLAKDLHLFDKETNKVLLLRKNAQLNEAYIYEGAEINSQYDYGIYVSGYAKENFKPRDTRIEIAK